MTNLIADLRNTKNLDYLSEQGKSTNVAKKYHDNTLSSPHRYLAYRDLPNLIEKHVVGKMALDYGAGTGISSQFLLNLGFQVSGVDISHEMLKQARIHCPLVPFYSIENGCIPLVSQSFDLVFSSFVLLEMKSAMEFAKYFREAKRVMKPNGTFIAVTGSQEFYSRNWLPFKTDYPENKNLKSGDKVKIAIIESNMEFTDFYWTETDYRMFFENAGLSLIEVLYPLGKATEPFPWKDEKTIPPFAVFVAKNRMGFRT